MRRPHEQSKLGNGFAAAPSPRLRHRLGVTDRIEVWQSSLGLWDEP